MRWRRVLLFCTLLAPLPPAARAQDATKTDTRRPHARDAAENISVRRSTSIPHTAAEFAPSRPLLTQTEPTSRVDAEQIRKTLSGTADYNDVITLTPSAMDVAPAGPGLQQDFAQSIRGLQYSEFTVRWDDIPVPGFPFNQAPQPGTYFFARDFSSVTINRGPGDASSIGPATFGGSVDLATRDPSADPGAELYGTFGSFETRLFGIEGDTGTIASTGGTRVSLDLTREEANGALTGINTERRNLFLKAMQPIGTGTIVTVAVNLDNDDTKTPYGATLADIDTFGRNYALNPDPTSQTFNGYNRDNYTTDFEYVDVKSVLGGGWSLDSRTFHTAYIQRDRHGLDPDGDTPNLDGPIFIAGQQVQANNDVPGLLGHFDFGDWGNLTRVSRRLGPGTLEFGVWVDRQGATIYQYNVDFSRNAVAYTNAPGMSPYASDFFSPTLQVQPYLQYVWRPRHDLTVTAGIKYDSATRAITGPIGLDGQSSNQHATWNTPLPSLDLNWRIRPYLSVFGQAARGFLIPELNVFGTTLPVSVLPSTTWSFQTGTVFNKDWLNAGVDLYDILFSNYIEGITLGGEPDYVNGGGAEFRGVEVEATARLGAGFAVYANGSLNDSAYNTNGNNLAQTPRRTAAAALLWDRGEIARPGDELYANAIEKVVGPQYGVDSAVPGTFDQFPIKSWNELDLNAGYRVPVFGQHLSFDVHANNVTNNRSFTGIFGETLEGTALYAVHAGRSIFFSVTDRI